MPFRCDLACKHHQSYPGFVPKYIFKSAAKTNIL